MYKSMLEHIRNIRLNSNFAGRHWKPHKVRWTRRKVRKRTRRKRRWMRVQR